VTFPALVNGTAASMRRRLGSPIIDGRRATVVESIIAIQQHPFSVVFNAARDRADLPAWATPHALRHDYASLLIRSGASVKVVQARLGHASAKTTLDVYGHLRPRRRGPVSAGGPRRLRRSC
jgi:integrase